MKYVVFQLNTILYSMDAKQPYPYNRYHVKEKDQLWKVDGYHVDKKSDELVFNVTCPKKLKKFAVECKEWYGMASDVVKIIL